MRTIFEQPALHECVAYAVRLSFELHEPAVMHDAVDDRSRHLVVPEDRSPAGELQVRRDHHRLALVGVGEDLEHEPRPVGIKRQEAEFVDDEQGRAADLRGLAVEPSFVAGAAKAHHQRRRGEETGLQAPVAGQLAQGARHVGLTRADVSHEHEVLPALEKRERKQVLSAEAVELARVGVRAASPHPRVGAVPATPGAAGAQAREAPCPAGGRARKIRGEGLGVPAHRLPRGLQGRRLLRGGRRPAGVVTNICFMPSTTIRYAI